MRTSICTFGLCFAFQVSSAAAPPAIDPLLNNAYVNSLCLQPMKIRDDGTGFVAPSEVGDGTRFLAQAVADRQKALAPLLGPFLTGDPLSAASLPDMKAEVPAASVTDRAAASSGAGATLETSTEDSRAALVYNHLISSGGGAMRLANIELSAPVAKKGDTQIHRLGEFASDAQIKVSFAWFARAWGASPKPVAADDLRRQILQGVRKSVQEECGRDPADLPCPDKAAPTAACGEKLRLACAIGPENILLRGDCVQKYAGDAGYAQYLDGYFAPQASWFGGFAAAVGYLEYDFKDPQSLEEKSDDRTPWSVELFFGRYSSSRRHLVRVGYEYVRGYKESDDTIVCKVPDPALPPECHSGKFAGAVDDDSDTGFVEWRATLPESWPAEAVTLKYTYDFDKEESEVDLPVYLFKNSDGKLNGGVRGLWNEEDDFGIGIFIGGAFSMDF